MYWDGVEKTLLDAKGDKVEPMIYDGTTYVPLRAMSNLMGKEVSWNQQEMTVYVGTTKVAATTPIDQFPKELIQRKDITVLTGENAKFNLKDKVIQCNNLLWGSGDSNTYILNNKYSRIVGKVVMPYTQIGSHDDGYVAFYNVENDGTENEITRYETRETEDPIDIDVNLRGVENLRIYWSSNGIALYDASFLAE